MNDIYALFELTPVQRYAAAERSRNLTVTAGAGSGKTRTLVARYLALLSEGRQPRRLAAITFTEKAAREMRSRTRAALQKLIAQAETGEERHNWAALEASMDSARIGTIHSLCAEIIRSHPAEAGVDPQFAVLEENQALLLQTRAVEDGLRWAVTQPEMRPLFSAYQIQGVEDLLRKLLAQRLEIDARSFDPSGFAGLLCEQMNTFLQSEEVTGIIFELRQARGGQLPAEAGEKLAGQVTLLLEQVERAGEALAAGDALRAAQALFTMRREYLQLRAGKTGPVKDAVKQLQHLYDSGLNAWLGGKNAKDPPPDEDVERLQAQTLPLLAQLYRRTEEQYLAALDERTSLDFDALEASALALLEQPEVRSRWQAEIQAVLVDEFQDTNARQRQIVLALSGDEPGRLFVVGDARQSIYRFRGADVTIFSGLQEQVAASGGAAVNMEVTFRAHAGLLEATGHLLLGMMGDQPQPGRPYAVPYAPLTAGRTTSPRSTAPYIEVVTGIPKDRQDARGCAARALARRLLEMRASGEIANWEEVTLLFRASTTFPNYEEALEAAHIPFVTVAGSGFYDRPEVRDVINLLRALANPWDDLALAGLLRSPAFGVSDAGLYRLRIDEQGRTRSLLSALMGDLSGLDATDRQQAVRARETVAELSPLVGRLPVAEVLSRLLERCDYRAVLAGGGSRLWRNVDKLLVDAAESGLVQVRAFLEYLETLRESAARESEAAPEADGAVRLMTIHKSKGLEFPFVVLADAARQNLPRLNGACRLGGCWTAPLAGDRNLPLAYRLAGAVEKDQDTAESLRLLYVALTRASEKLLLSGHISLDPGGRVQVNGWLGQLMALGGMAAEELLENPSKWRTFDLQNGSKWAGCAYADEDFPEIKPAAALWPDSLAAPLAGELPRLAAPEAVKADTQPGGIHPHQTGSTPPARVVGELVHLALQRWLFPGAAGLDALLLAKVREEGLVEASLAGEAVSAARKLLARFQQHPLYAEMQAAGQRYHELPYQVLVDGQADSGFIDCLYRGLAGWIVVDFKCDHLRTAEELDEAVEKHRTQLERYCRATMKLLHEDAIGRMAFLDAGGQVRVVESSPA